MNLEQMSVLIENGLKKINIDPVTTARGEKPGQWTYKTKEGATMWIDVFSFPAAPDKYYLQVMSPVCAVPDKNADAFYKDLLEINYKMYDVSMCKKENWIYVLCLRDAVSIDETTLDTILYRVSFYSNDYYGKLSFKYEGSWAPKAPETKPDSSLN